MTSSDGLEDGAMPADGTGSTDGGAARDGGGPPPERAQAREAVAVAALAVVAFAAATPHVEPLAGAGANAGAGAGTGLATLVGCLGVAAVTPALVRIDIVERRLPNVLVGVAAGAWGVSTALLVAGGDPAAAGTSLALALATAVLGLVAALAGGLGMGDVKLAAVLTGLLSTGDLTALLGFWGLAGTLAIGAAGVRTFGSRSRGSRLRPPADPTAPVRGVPFGPCLLAAFWCVVASGPAAVGSDAFVTVL